MRWDFWSREPAPDSNFASKMARKADEDGEYVKAVGQWRNLAESGDAEGAFELAVHLEHGRGTLQSFVDAVRWYKTAADRGWISAAARLGDIYFSGRDAPLTVIRSTPQKSAAPGNSALASLTAASGSIPVDFGEAAKWNKLAAEQGDAGSQIRFAYQCAGGLGREVDFAAAEHWFSVAAATGDPTAQFGMGLIHAGGNGRPRNFAKAKLWMERAADQDHSAAQVCLAVLLAEGKSSPDDYIRAANLLKRAAEADNKEAMFLYGEYRRFGIGCDADASEAESWLRRAAIKGHIGAMTAVASLLKSQSNPDYASAAAFYRDAADLGDGPAQFALGELYVEGRGVPRDPKQAAIWFEKAADKGVVAAYQRLGAMYADGLGFDQNFEAAASWFGRAAESGGGAANFEIATLHHYGLGVPVNPQRALEHYRIAEREGDIRAILRLGILHAQGDIVEQDYSIAANYYGRAAALGSTEAKLNLAFLMIRELGETGSTADGEARLVELGDSGQLDALWALYKLYSEGVYVSVNEVEADKWLKAAANLGSPAAALELGRRLRDNVASPVSTADTLSILEKAARSGQASAQSMLGRILFEGQRVTKDAGAALTWLTRAANQGDVFAQAWLGDVLSTGQGVLVDHNSAAAWYLNAAKQGHSGALRALTAMYTADDAGPEKRRIIFDLWHKFAEEGDGLAQRMIGDFYARGVGCTSSPIEAARWLRQSSEQGNVAAKVILAGLLLQGKAVAVDQSEPSRLLQQAASEGNVDAEYNLGVCYKVGLGVDANADIAKFWYRAAADHGHPSAQLALADLLLENRESHAEALRLYTVASAAGVAGAAFGLGRIHEEGLGVPPNRELALAFYKRAAQAGHAAAITAIAAYQDRSH